MNSELLSVPNVVFAMLSISLALAFIRVLIGPSAADRVVALDLIAIISVALIAMYNIITDVSLFLDAAIAVALVGFLSTVAIAHYLERMRRND